MIPATTPFEFDYFGSDIVYGPGTASDLGTYLASHGYRRAMVVTGTNVGANDRVMEPIVEGLGERLVATFDRTTPEKDAETVFDGIEMLRATDADVIVGVGSGSSLDIARQISAFDSADRPLSSYRAAARAGELAGPTADETATPVVVVPVTLAGADISNTGAMRILTAEESPTGETIRTYGEVRPIGMFYDPTLFETTPDDVMAASAMNGFDKAIETHYSADYNPITSATANHALRSFSESLPRLSQDDPDAYDRAVVGIILAQFQRRTSVISSFGHGTSRHLPVHQGVIHGVLSPHVLDYLFEHLDGNRELMADGLGVDTAERSHEELGRAVVDEVERIRDGLGLPSRLRDVGSIAEANIQDIATRTLTDEKMAQAPDGLDPTVEELAAVLRRAW
jgi:alcohol dehydrogenase